MVQDRRGGGDRQRGSPFRTGRNELRVHACDGVGWVSGALGQRAHGEFGGELYRDVLMSLLRGHVRRDANCEQRRFLHWHLQLLARAGLAPHPQPENRSQSEQYPRRRERVELDDSPL